jgi:hypothetical protein
VSLVDKFDAIAEQYSELDYADASAYYRHRAELVIRHGPELPRSSTLIDFACGDAGVGVPLVAAGIDYHGIDASPHMVEVAQRTLGGRVQMATFDYNPPKPVDATTIFRSLYLVPDRLGFLRRAREFTRVKLVFDFDPRARDASQLYRDLRSAGWASIEIRPFLMPQRVRLPVPLQRLLFSLEPLRAARLVTRVRFPLLVSAA